jgi:hypothetical protein
MLHLESPIRAANGEPMLERLAFCIAASTVCSQTCVSCSEAALSGADFAVLRSCSKAAQDCADICALTAKLLLRATDRNQEVIRCQMDACLAACRRCRIECDRQVSVLEFCGVCMSACLVCEQSCAELAAALAS